MKNDPGFLKLRKIRAAQKISKIIASSSANRVYLPADTLMLNIASSDYLDVLSDKKGRR